jgi:hypothetical protein
VPLRPDKNTLYWQYLLTDPLYLLPQDLVAPSEQQAAEISADGAVAIGAAQRDAAQPGAAQPGAAQPGAAQQDAAPSPAQEAPPTYSHPGNAPEAAGQAAPQPDLLWGSLHRGVLILVDYPGHTLMDRPDGLFLVDILKAIGYEFKEVATLNISRCKSAADWEWVRQQPWQKLISFGVQHPELPFTQQPEQYVLKTDAGRPIIQVDPLPQIRADVALKKQLWNLLKGYFV